MDIIDQLVEIMFGMNLDDKLNIPFYSNFTLDGLTDLAESFIIDIELYELIFKDKSD